MDRITFAPQQAAPAADARPWNGFGHGYQWCSVVTSRLMSSFENAITTKRPTRRLGMPPT